MQKLIQISLHPAAADRLYRLDRDAQYRGFWGYIQQLNPLRIWWQKWTSRDSNSRFYFGSQPRNSSAALSGSVRRPCIPTTFAAAPPAWSRLLTETSFLLLHQELSVVCSCCSSTERHAVMLAHLFSWLARTFGRQMFWQRRNQMTCFHRGTNSLFDIRKKEKKQQKTVQTTKPVCCWSSDAGYSVRRVGTALTLRGQESHIGESCDVSWQNLYWEAAATSSASITFTCTSVCVQSLESPRRARAYCEKDINHSCSQRWIQNADVGLAFGEKWEAPWCKSLIFRLKHWREKCLVAAACLHAAFVSH